MRIDQWNAVAAAGKLCDGIECDPKNYNSKHTSKHLLVFLDLSRRVSFDDLPIAFVIIYYYILYVIIYTPAGLTG